jgi:hypothetical protein
MLLLLVVQKDYRLPHREKAIAAVLYIFFFRKNISNIVITMNYIPVEFGAKFWDFPGAAG